MASPFSGKAGRNAAIWAAGQLQQTQEAIMSKLEGAKAEALPYLQANPELIRQGYGQALTELGKYYGMGAEAIGQGVDVYDPLIEKAGTGYDMYLNALGLKGAGGTQAAQEAFSVSPGYQFQVEQSTDAAQRAANKIGMLYSGNTTTAVQDRANALASQEYGNWLTRLGAFPGLEQQARAGQAGQLGQLGTLYGTQGTATAGLYTGQAGELSNANINLANLPLGVAAQEAGVLGNIGTQIAQIGLQGMMAGQQAASNRMGAIMGGISGLMGMFGKMGGMGF